LADELEEADVLAAGIGYPPGGLHHGQDSLRSGFAAVTSFAALAGGGFNSVAHQPGRLLVHGDTG